MRHAMRQLWQELVYFFKVNLRYISDAILLALPYVMYCFGRQSSSSKWELLIPLGALALVYVLREVANRAGTGNQVPIPSKRFSKVDASGEVLIEHDRLEELILYVADLEDWLERKGLL